MNKTRRISYNDITAFNFMAEDTAHNDLEAKKKRSFIVSKVNWKWSKSEMARVNTDILGTSELTWTGMGEFNSDYHYIYYCGQEFLRRNGVVLIVNKSLKYSTWVQSQK